VAASCGPEKAWTTTILCGSNTRWRAVSVKQEASKADRREGVPINDHDLGMWSWKLIQAWTMLITKMVTMDNTHPKTHITLILLKDNHKYKPSLEEESKFLQDSKIEHAH